MKKIIAIILFIMCFLVGSTVFASTLFESYTINNDWAQIYSPVYQAIPFTATSDHSISSIDLLLFRYGSPGTITVNLTNISGGFPGDILATASINGDSITDSNTGEWLTFTLNSTVNVNTGDMLAIEVYCSGTDSSHAMGVRNYNGSAYPYFTYQSLDNGSSWDRSYGVLTAYKVYGDVPVTPPSGNVNLTATSSLTTIMSSALNSVITIALEVFNSWFIWILVIGLISRLVYIIARFLFNTLRNVR